MKTAKFQIAEVCFAAVLLCFSAEFAHAKYNAARFPSASEFSRPKDNKYFPKTLGVTTVYKTENKDTIITNEVTITHNTITIQGIVCPVVSDVEWTFVKRLNKKFMTKETFTFYAWDNRGNVWCFGKDSLKYVYNKNWRLLKIDMSGTWLAGVRGTLPGIVVPASPASLN